MLTLPSSLRVFGRTGPTDNVPISGEQAPEISIDDFRKENIACHETLGGPLKHYERKAA